MPQTPQLRVSLAFAGIPEQEIDNFTQGVSDGLYSTAAYTTGPDTPPVTKVALDASNVALTQAISAAKQGGPADTAAKNVLLQTHIGYLRLLAAYVQLKNWRCVASAARPPAIPIGATLHPTGRCKGRRQLL